MASHYRELLEALREVATLCYVENLLAWDQEVLMPSGAGEFRAEQTALLTRLTHERSVAPRIGELLERCEADAQLLDADDAAANVREVRRSYDRQRKLSSDLAAESSETNSRAIQVWKQARANDDFDSFRPWLERQIAMAQARAEAYGAPAGGELYDALVQNYEPDLIGADIDRIFGPLRAELTALIAEIAQAPQVDDPLADLGLTIGDQQRFHQHVLERVGFDSARGRLDVSTHPFSTSLAPSDARLTTRYFEDRFADSLCATMHEAGHALYEQGRPTAKYPGQPVSDHASLGVHESQSRLWENHVGRSLAFWNWAIGEARPFFGSALDGVDGAAVFRSLNRVGANPIRVESDETGYNLHIMLRFDLERAMVRGDLQPADLPAAWNDRMRDDLGVTVTSAAQGCLQDMHWAMGAIGYFPSYSLGNLYAAQLWEALTAVVADAETGLGRGEFAPVLDWLGEHIHAHGRRYPAPELIERATGETLDHAPLIRHLRKKLATLYGLQTA